MKTCSLIFSSLLVSLPLHAQTFEPVPSSPRQELEQPIFAFEGKVLQVIEGGKGVLVKEGEGTALLLGCSGILTSGDVWQGWIYKATSLYHYQKAKDEECAVPIYVSTGEPATKEISKEGKVLKDKGYAAGSHHALFIETKTALLESTERADAEKFGVSLSEYYVMAKSQGKLTDVQLEALVSLFYQIWLDREAHDREAYAGLSQSNIGKRRRFTSCSPRETQVSIVLRL